MTGPRNGGVSFWYANTAMPGRRPPLQGDVDVDVCIVGGGFTGLWTAYYLKEAQPDLDVLIVEREFAGYGASGRNGGWLSSAFNGSRAAMAQRHGAAAVVALSRAMQETVDEVLSVCADEGIAADQRKSGLLTVARNPAQAARLRAELPDQRRWLPDPVRDLVALGADETLERVRVEGALTGTWSPHAARVQPAKLVQGLAAAVERRGVAICEGTTATAVAPGRVETDRGVVRARHALTCLEGFTAGLRGHRRTWLPLNSAMIATAPLSEDAWQRIGWDRAEVLGDGAHAYMYAQRTADGRIALGGRGVPYRFGSRTDRDGRTQPQTISQLVHILRDMFGEPVRDVPIEHAWCGVLGVPRDWSPTVTLDRATGLGMAGGYVGNGVATTNLAGRTLRDLVLGRDTPLTRLPWVGKAARRWEPEPLRFIGSRLVYGLYREADRREMTSGAASTHPLAKLASVIAGREPDAAALLACREMDPVMTGVPPRAGVEAALEIAAAAFGVPARAARDLGSERDKTFLLLGDGDRPLAVLKVSNASEDPEVLDMEAAAALHVATVDPELAVALPWRAASSREPGSARPGDDIAQLRAAWDDGDQRHWARLYDALPGNSRISPVDLSDAALVAWGETTARLGQALRAFTHPRAVRTMVWDVQHALATRPMLADIRDPRARAAVTRVLDAFEARASPRWPHLRAQVLHGDLTVDNTLTDDDGCITGIVDFGDMSHTALVTDLASVLDSVAAGRDGDELFRAARLVLDGYQRRVLLEDEDLEVLGVAWAARSALTIAISSWRVAQGLEDAAFAERYNGVCLRQLEALEAPGWDEVARRLGADATREPDRSLAGRRAAAFGPAMDPLFYDEPIQVASAERVWITDAAGRTYLDAYNNVPSVGHAHPRVAAAIARQSRRVNTHTRYLHPTAIELSERLLATCPPELDTVLLVNSGSEANDLAWRMATTVTGRRGGLCTAFAYHGITEAIAALSPEGWLDGDRPEHVETWEPPDAYRETHLDAEPFAAAVARLRARGHEPAAAILDGLITSDRIADLEPAYVQELVRRTREAGALWIADEVQSGHGRTGDALWAFQRFGVVPDFVTLGKPMGNGHPVAAVITRRAIAEQLVGRTTLFSTFGGNPVSAAAALAVLDALEDERVLERVQRTGEALRRALRDVAAAHPAIGDVRGAGLACAVELVTDPATRAPDGVLARRVRDRMRHLGVLVGTTGRDGNIIKIRPPLAFDVPHVSVLSAALDAALRP